MSDRDLFGRDRAETAGAMPMVVAVEGPPSSFFRESEKSTLNARLLVVGDSDFAGSLARYTGTTRNLDFLPLAADWLSARDDLVSTRRPVKDTTLNSILDPEEKSRVQGFARDLGMIWLPLGLLLFGLLIMLIQKWKRFGGSRE